MHVEFLERAIDLGRQSIETGDGGPFGAVVARAGEWIADGRNCVTGTRDPTAHAEIVAIREACRKLGRFSLDDCQLYSSCEPCPMCLGAVYWSHICGLTFAAGRDDAQAIGFDDARIYDEIARDLSARRLPTSQALREKARAMMDLWRSVGPERRY